MSEFPSGHSMWMLAPLLACESPIEEAFLQALAQRARARQLTMVVLEGTSAYPVTPDFGNGRLLQVHCQLKVGRYRLDFALELVSRMLRSSGILAVECDGHDYHERTKEQAVRDRARDREMQKWGAHVFRFTGSEIHRDAPACADQSLAFLEAKLTDVEQQ